MPRAKRKAAKKKRNKTEKKRRGRRHDVTLGAEVETYTITLDNMKIGRYFMLPRKGVVERGESYHHDRSIGIEYASRPYRSIRESLFGIKAGLRKHMATYRLDRGPSTRPYALFFAGTWRDRFAATHFHVGLGDEGIEFEKARRLSRHVHGHLPFLMALLANSPVYKKRITSIDSNRCLHAGDRFFYPLEPGVLDTEYREELTFNRSRKKRIPTLEVRPCDANLPEYMAAGLVVMKAVTMGWLAKKPPNRNDMERHMKARDNAGRYGPMAVLYWNNRPLSARAYLDRFFREYGRWLSEMDIPPEVAEVFKLFQAGWNGAGILRRAAQRHYKRHPRVWERYFAEEYAEAVNALLNGETLPNFARMLGLRPPPTKDVKLGSLKI